MLPPLFYDYETMTVTQWFDMLSKDDLQNGHATYVYKLSALEAFEVDGQQQQAGTYYVRTVKANIEEFKPFCVVRKLSFSELVYLSDVFSWVIPAAVPTDDKLQELVDKGEAANYFEKEIVSTKGLEKLRAKVSVKYFDDSLMGVVRRIFSSLINFFRKYNLYIETGIYWPGNSCDYADKVIGKINRIKQAFVELAFEACKEALSEQLDISLEELESNNIGQLKKIYHQKVRNLHPDKNPDEPLAGKSFNKINRVWCDFLELAELNEGFQKIKNGDTKVVLTQKESEEETKTIQKNDDKPSVLQLPIEDVD